MPSSILQQMSQPETAIIIANKFELPAALTYQKAYPQEPVKLIPADISSTLACQKQKLNFTPLFEFFKAPSTPRGLYRLPYKLTRKFLAQPRIKSQLKLGDLDLTLPLAEMLRFDLVYSLEKYYLLHQLHRQLQFTKLIATTSLFSSQILQTFSHHYQINWQNLNTKRGLTHKWQNLLQLLKNHSILLRQPRLLLPGLKKSSVSRQSVLVFSNGLNLASYHSVIKSLEKFIPVNLFTSHQTPLDRFFLNQYHLATCPINFHQPAIARRSKVLSRQIIKLQSNFKPQLPALPQNLPVKVSIIRHLLVRRTQKLIGTWLKNFFRYYAAASYLMENTQPRLVITTHDPGPSGLAFTLAAKEKNLPTAILLHGSPSEIHFFFADKQVIWGPRMKQLLTKHGVKSQKLLLGGHPIYYDYLKYFRRRHSFTRPPFTLGILTSGFGRNEINQVEFFIRLFPELAKVKTIQKIIIRTHATQQLDGLKDLAQKYRLNIIFNPSLLLEEFIAQSDLVITQDSTAALVPLIAQKPTIALPTWMPFTDRGFVLNSDAFLKPKPNQSLSQLINKILQDKALVKTNGQQQQHFLRQYCGPIDAKIGERVAKKLLTLIR